VLTAVFFAVFYVAWVYWAAAIVFPPAAAPPV
jgi:hypothetical protein